jgi:hypothetical protein
LRREAFGLESPCSVEPQQDANSERSLEPSGRSFGLVGKSEEEVVCLQSIAGDSRVLPKEVEGPPAAGQRAFNAAEPVQTVLPGSHISGGTGLTKTRLRDGEDLPSPPAGWLKGAQVFPEDGTHYADGDLAPNKAGSISSPTSSHYSHLSSSITSFVEEAKSFVKEEKTLGASNYLRVADYYCWMDGPEKGQICSREHGQKCLERRPKFYNPLLEPVFQYYKQEHKDSKEIQDD